MAKCSRTQPVYFSERDISHDRLLRLPEGSLQRTGKPFHVEFTMSPAVEVRLRVEDPQGKRLEPIKVVAHWTAGSPRQFSPSESCFCCNEYHAWPAFDQDPADPSGRLRCDLISHKDSTFFEYQQFRAGIARAFSVYLDPAAEGEIPKPSGTSPAVPFPEPGRYIVRVRYDRDAPAGSRLTVLGSRKTP